MSTTYIPGLLPCPFCGSTEVQLNARPLHISWIVECFNCKARGPVAHTLIEGKEERETAVNRAKRQAADGWNNNRRTKEAIEEWMEMEEMLS